MARVLTAKQPLVEYEIVISKIVVMCGQRVMFAKDLADLYGIETKVSMQAVKRTIARFPADFPFQLTAQEFANLRSQFVTSNWAKTRYMPYVFTAQGVAMFSGVLKSPRAIAVNIEIMRSLVRMRAWIDTIRELAKKLAALEQRYGKPFKVVFQAIYDSMDDGEKKPNRKIGFV